MSLGPKALLTLTYRHNETDLTQAKRDLKAFVRKVRKVYPGFHYAGAPERQKRGAVHFHLAVNTFLPANWLRGLWREVVGQGNVDLKAVDDPRRVASYLCKYLAKDLTAHGGQASYLRSRGIPEPRKSEFHVEELGQAFAPLAGPDWSGTYVTIERGGKTAYWSASWA